MARRHSFGRRRAGSVRRCLFPDCRALRFEPLEARLCLSAAQLLSHWTFDDAYVFGDIVLDTSVVGSLENGTKRNGGPATGVVGVVGEAADFFGGPNNSNSHFVDLDDHADDFVGLSTGTIAAWVKPEIIGDPGEGNPTDVLTIFSVSRSSVGSEEMRFFVSNGGPAHLGVGKLAYGVRTEPSEEVINHGEVVSTSSDLLDGEWHHVAVTVGAGDQVDIYIDGTHEGSATIPFLSVLDADSAAVGRNRDSNTGGGQWFFRGLMDDVGLWTNALTEAEVRALVELAQHPQLNYDLGQAEGLFNRSDFGSGSEAVDGRIWEAASELTGPVGEVFVDATTGAMSLNLGGGKGVQSAAAPLIVTSTADVGPGTLRAVIDQANSVAGADTITFDQSVDGGTVLMNLGEMQITEALTIDATSLIGGFSIDAQQQSRIFDITSTAGDFILAGLTLTGGQATADGGAIRSLTNGTLTLDQSTVIGNSTTGSNASGGGIFASRHLSLIQSTVSGNSTTGSSSVGGGITAGGNVTLLQSTVSGNSTHAFTAAGGGIHARLSHVTLTQSTVSGNTSGANGGGIYSLRNVTLTQSAVSGNSAAGDGGGIYGGNVTLSGSTVSDNSAGELGGGIRALGNVTLSQSTVSGNSTGSLGGRGGGIYAFVLDGSVTLTDSTVSGNSAERGGGLYAANVTLHQSTMSGNSARFGGGIATNHVSLVRSTVAGNSAQSSGGGINVSSIGNVSLTGSILAGNMANVSPELRRGFGTLSVSYSLIGNTSGSGITAGTGTGNVLNVNPRLDPLAHNGGPTFTHALLPDSPALDAGNPAAAAGMGGVPEFDQRVMPFTRVHGGRIDIGAFEVQPGPLPGDFSVNGAVENADLTLLLNNWGNPVPPTPAGWVGVPLTTPAVDNDELTALLNNWGSVAGGGAVADGSTGRANGTLAVSTLSVHVAPQYRFLPQGEGWESTAGQASSGTRASPAATGALTPALPGPRTLDARPVARATHKPDLLMWWVAPAAAGEAEGGEVATSSVAEEVVADGGEPTEDAVDRAFALIGDA